MSTTQDSHDLHERQVYDHRAIEARWQARWLESGLFAAKADLSLPKYYVLDFFPYPSGTGLHVGHPLGYVATDIVARYKRHRGFNVLHPMGWDAFGLPAEQHALKTGVHPALTTRRNIETFRRQLRSFGFSYDWSREVDTTDPSYYRWTQWIFLKLLERGLAYQAEVPVNWCPALGTVLANEEVIDGRSEIGGHPVIRRPMKQWLLRITAYAERLVKDLELLDWPDHIKALQRNWIGRSTGAEVDFRVEQRGVPGDVPAGYEVPAGDGTGSYDTGAGPTLRIFTTRPDTLFGATYMVISPEHPLADRLATPERARACSEYRAAAASKTDFERSALNREKTGVFTGSYAINPVSDERLPIWIADYVMMGYGTGAIMAVPGHDERDHEFARTMKLPILEVVREEPLSAPDGAATAAGASLPSGALHERVQAAAYTGDGTLVNSGLLDGLDVPAAKARITEWLAEKGVGRPAVHTRLRDWLFSRQRYWGEPFPLLHHADGSISTVPEADLPVRLPEVEKYQPSGTGESPLATVPAWVETTDPVTGAPVRRETHTMPQWAGSCWYYLRFIDPRNEQALVDPALEKYWMPVDLYVGGAEHATLHLLYARFWHKVLFDAGVVSTPEPFHKLYCQGMILGEDHEKMSKSRGNTVSPDDVLPDYGADAFRLYEMFMGPLTAVKPWQTAGLSGTHRFLKRAWRLYVNDDGALAVSDAPPSAEVNRAWHRTLAKVTEDIEALAFNTAVSTMMEFVNLLVREGAGMPRALADGFLRVLSPFAPHITEELNVRLHGEAAPSLAWQPWPELDTSQLVDDEVEIAVQVNGKVRAAIRVPRTADAAALQAAARAEPSVQKLLQGAQVKKVVAVPGRIVNFVLGTA